MALTVDVNVASASAPVGPPAYPAFVPDPNPGPPSHSSTLFTYVVIAGISFLPESWECNFPAYGSVGTYSIITSIAELQKRKLNLYDVTLASLHPVSVDIYVNLNGTITHLWGGELDDTDWAFDDNQVTISGRDWAGVMVDQKITLANYSAQGAAGIPISVTPISGGPSNAFNVQNQTAVQLITQIAKAHGLQPLPTSIPASEQTVLVGNLLANSGVFNNQPQPEWEIIQAISRLMGWNTYVTPERQLVFGPTATSNNKLLVSWNITNPPKGTVPCQDLQVMHQPRRNSSFLVVVQTYNLAMIQQSKQMIGLPSQGMLLNYPLYKVDGRGFYTTTSLGANVSTVTALFKNLGKEIYVVHRAGLTPDQASLLAENTALDLAKREIIVNFSIDGLPSLRPFMELQLSGKLQGFEGRKLFINGVKHTYSTPDEGEIGTSGFMSHVSAWSLPLAAGVTQVL